MKTFSIITTRALRQLPMVLLTLTATTALALPHGADDDELRWGIGAGLGAVSMEEPYRGLMGANEGDLFWAAADYRLTHRWVLTGGLYWERNGLFTQHDYDGIGLVKYSQAGLQGGMKYYFCPRRWVVQPYVGARMVSNVLNLGHHSGSRYARTSVGQSSVARLDYTVRCPALSVEPMVGADVHLFSSVSLTLDVGYRYGFYGHNEGTMRFISGPLMGVTEQFSEHPRRMAYSLGLKVELPLQKVSERAFNNLLWLVRDFIENRARR